MPDWITSSLETAVPYWPFITKVITIWYLGQLFKKRVWTKANAAGSKFYAFMRATLPFHPLVAGMVWGLLYPWLPAVEFVTTRGGAVNEGILAAVLTVVVHTGLEHYAATQNITWLLAILRETVPTRETSVPPPPGSVQ